MPQLMPLNWVFSTAMVILVMISASVIYSEEINNSMMSESKNKVSKMKNLWCW